MEIKKNNYKLEIDILRNFQHKKLGVLGVLFKGLGVQKMLRCPAG